MTALHLACEDLIRSSCRVAIVAGINILEKQSYVRMSAAGLLGDSAGVRSFESTRGMLPSEGMVAVMLKPLAAAIADGDCIRAVIKSTAVSNTGTESEYAPVRYARTAQFLDRCSVDPRTISYVEGASFGESSTDAIEVWALSKALLERGVPRGGCALGTVKMNIGHALSLSGLTQLTKVILQFQHEELVPAIASQSLNSGIEFEQSALALNASLVPWKRRSETARRALIVSVGGGGALVHVLLEEPPSNRKVAERPQQGSQVVILSARDEVRLRAYLGALLEYSSRNRDADLRDVAYTLQTGREPMEARFATVVDNMGQLEATLRDFLNPDATAAVSASKAPVFVKFGATVDYGPEPGTDPGQPQRMAYDWVAGGKVDWSGLAAAAGRRRVVLPTYPFQSAELT